MMKNLDVSPVRLVLDPIKNVEVWNLRNPKYFWYSKCFFPLLLFREMYVGKKIDLNIVRAYSILYKKVFLWFWSGAQRFLKKCTWTWVQFFLNPVMTPLLIDLKSPLRWSRTDKKKLDVSPVRYGLDPIKNDQIWNLRNPKYIWLSKRFFLLEIFRKIYIRKKTDLHSIRAYSIFYKKVFLCLWFGGQSFLKKCTWILVRFFLNPVITSLLMDMKSSLRLSINFDKKNWMLFQSDRA